jgi:hypothetical protein
LADGSSKSSFQIKQETQVYAKIDLEDSFERKRIIAQNADKLQK